MEKWLRRNNMSTNDFVKQVGCSRPIVWKVKRGLPICPKYAKRIYLLTKGEVKPKVRAVGRGT